MVPFRILFLLSVFSLFAFQTSAHAFVMDQNRGVWTLAPVLKKASRSIVRIQLDSRHWRKGRAGPGGVGSGFVVDAENGYILTNHHVVSGARKVFVFFSPQERYRAFVIGRDKNSDIAILKVNAKGLKAIPIGNSDKAQIGDFTIAVGFPFGLGRTSSFGIISAGGGPVYGRYNEERHSIQIDAAINPGNSGGPFLNSKGEVIGINTSIVGDQSGTSLGIGFGVPINVAVRVMNKLIEKKRLSQARPVYLGKKSSPVVQTAGLKRSSGPSTSTYNQNTAERRINFTNVPLPVRNPFRLQ